MVNSFLCSVAYNADCDETKLHQVYKCPLKIQISNLHLSHLNTADNYLIECILLQFEEHMIPKEKLLRMFLPSRSPHLLKGRKDELIVKVEKWETASAGDIPPLRVYRRSIVKVFLPWEREAGKREWYILSHAALGENLSTTYQVPWQNPLALKQCSTLFWERWDVLYSETINHPIFHFHTPGREVSGCLKRWFSSGMLKIWKTDLSERKICAVNKHNILFFKS